MKTSLWFDAVALLLIAFISVVVGATTDEARYGQARAAHAVTANR